MSTKPQFTVTAMATARAKRGRRFRETKLGIEARCSRCGDWWPADGEFYFMTKGRPHSWCKACYIANDVATGRRRNYGGKHCHNDHAREE